MHLSRTVLPGLVILAGTTLSFGQNAPVTPTLPAAVTTPAIAKDAPDKLLLKVGLNAGRSLRWGGYEGWSGRVPISLAAEYAVSPKFTLYSQLDTDVDVLRRQSFDGRVLPLVSSGAIGVGGRYYYNQEGRARANRAHGLFVGNYVGLEVHTELERYNGTLRTGPSLNALWGMQRRLGRNFLFDFNAGVGFGPNSSAVTGYRTSVGTIATQFNLGIFFGR
ncbi:hypothetical protein MUN81_21725 [Hymenobacter sp. 5317J-9]|uniref:hypothetical protein n=1 Tax=Hymenobacter sp. 5317J-9 TaxID=2932250 RepID=UPI001FD651D3|nr:hypothetical protein [Hymenobacter sp. 5317J-9]UOQ97833.1 hypothetical protein MUN81_21725 [Hymenobacter sp. 5317J-9]